jgi:hypothetical protein
MARRDNHTKAAIQIPMNIVLFILPLCADFTWQKNSVYFRMSKCQRNKYFLGTPPSEKKCNPEFQSSMSKLLSDREKQDLQFSLPLPLPLPSQQPPSHQQQSQQIVVKQPQTQNHQTSRSSDITTILSGDTE